MAIPTPTIPSSVPAVSAVALKSTQNNRAFYVYSGIVSVDNTETTLVSINDIGKRDIIICIEAGCETDSSDNYTFRFKVNGTTVFARQESSVNFNNRGMMQFIAPANTSIECTLDNESSASARNFTIAGYGYYMEQK
jgi:hypothetical protein